LRQLMYDSAVMGFKRLQKKLAAKQFTCQVF
jgi:hypothetical protein